MLLGTDLRWSVAAGPLIEAIEATGIVPPDELDLLARAFISADAKVYWRCPDGWFSTVGIAVSDIEFPPAAPDADPDDSEETGPTVASRVVAPGLRRWAAARAVRLDPSAWPAVLARSHEVGAAGGGGLMHGLLDSIEVLPLKARSLVRQEALNSGRSDVRQAALQQIALIDWSLARTSGMRDANERVRRWAAGIVDPSAAVSPATELTLDSGAPRLTSKQSAVAQASLFD